MSEIKNIKSLFKIVSVFVSAFTIFGIFQISKAEGPCNGGLIFLVIMPLFILAFLFLILSMFYFFRKYKFKNAFCFSLISFLIWSFAIIFFHDLAQMILYLIPLELLITIWLFYIYSNDKKAIT
ncbi:hypothetical protein D3C87_532320 [compost metagenome]